MPKALRIKSVQGDYRVDFTAGVAAVMDRLLAIPNAVFVLDRNVGALWAPALEVLTSRRPTCLIDATEEEKSLAGATRVLEFLQDSGGTRGTRVIAIGGGITQDIAAFAAHLYYRGLPWLFVPTTLLAMADSCIGAKNAVNFRGFKNQLGAFHSPAEVLIATNFLDTLADVEVLSGYGEILKLALTGSEGHFARLSRALDRGGLRNPSVGALVRSSLAIKRRFIEADEHDSGVRRLLNYGHTFGHALEAVTRYAVPHGIAVAWGLDLANHIAVRMGHLPQETCDRVHGFVQRTFATQSPPKVAASDLLAYARRDKKASAGRLLLVLLEHPGSLVLRPVAIDGELERVIDAFVAATHEGSRDMSALA